MKENIFFIIVNDDFPTRISYRHDKLEDAMTEAKRLARNNPENKFVVMKSVIAYQVNEFVISEFVPPCDNKEDLEYIPF